MIGAEHPEAFRGEAAQRAARGIAECCSRISVREAGDGAVVIEIEGEVDGANAAQLDDALAKCFEGPSRILVVDLSRTSFIDLIAFRSLLLARRQTGAAATPRLMVAGIDGALAVLRAAQAEMLFECYPSVADALAVASTGEATTGS